MPDAKRGNPKAAPIPSPPSTSLQPPPVFNQRGAQQVANPKLNASRPCSSKTCPLPTVVLASGPSRIW